MHSFKAWMFVAAATAALPHAALGQASAGAYPTRPVTLMIAFAPGGPVDREFRLYAPKMSGLLGQSFLTDFKPGASGMVAAAYVAKAKPDGYTLIAFTNSLTAAAAALKNPPVDIVKDLAPVSLVNKRVPIMVASPVFGPKTFKDYLAYARANPGKVNISNSGVGNSSHLASAWLHDLAKAKVTFVHYKGAGQVLADLVAGRVDVSVMAVLAAMPLIKSGKARPLAILDDKRSSVLPEVPTAAEEGLTGFGYSNWMGVAAPAGTPGAVINKLSEAFAKVVKMPDIAAPIEKQAVVMIGGGPAEFRQIMIDEIARWRKVVKDNNITAEGG